MSQNFVKRFLIKNRRISFSIFNDMLPRQSNRRMGKISLLSEVFSLSQLLYVCISALLVIHVAYLRMNIFVCRCTREASDFAAI